MHLSTIWRAKVVENKVAQIYAQALFNTAKANDIISVVFEEVDFLLKHVLSNENLMRFLKTPQVKKQTKHNAVKKILEGKISPQLLNLFLILIDNL